MGPVRQNPIQRTISLFICVCSSLCTTVAHNTAQNRPDNFLSCPPTMSIAPVTTNAGQVNWCANVLRTSTIRANSTVSHSISHKHSISQLTASCSGQYNLQHVSHSSTWQTGRYGVAIRRLILTSSLINVSPVLSGQSSRDKADYHLRSTKHQSHYISTTSGTSSAAAVVSVNFYEWKTQLIMVKLINETDQWRIQVDWVMVLHHTRHKICHFGDALPSQSLG